MTGRDEIPELKKHVPPYTVGMRQIRVFRFQGQPPEGEGKDSAHVWGMLNPIKEIRADLEGQRITLVCRSSVLPQHFTQGLMDADGDRVAKFLGAKKITVENQNTLVVPYIEAQSGRDAASGDELVTFKATEFQKVISKFGATLSQEQIELLKTSADEIEKAMQPMIAQRKQDRGF